MRIAIIVSSFLPSAMGGTQIATYNIAKFLSDRGHEVHVITIKDRKEKKFEIMENFYVHRIKFTRLFTYTFGEMLYYLKILFIVKKSNIEVIHVQMIRHGRAGVLIKKLAGIPFVVSPQGSDIYKSSIYFKKTIAKFVFKNADVVIALTNNMKKEIQKIYKRKVVIVPNGVDIRQFENLDKGKIRKELKISKQKKVILFVGRLHSIKGVKYLIQAIKIILNKDKNVKLLIVGDGDERKNLENLCKNLNLENHVTFVGEVSPEKVPKYMVASDIFVLPSLSESFGIVNIQAMYCGLPIVATNVGGIPENVIDQINGFLIEPRNEYQIAEKVILLLNNNELREKISENNKEKASNYSWERVVEKLEKLYETIKI